MSDKHARVIMAANLELVPATGGATNTSNSNSTAPVYESDQDTVLSERNPYLDVEAVQVSDKDEEDSEEMDNDKRRRRRQPSTPNTSHGNKTSATLHEDDTNVETIKTPKQFYMPPTEVLASCQLTWNYH
jgi:hypothetical protein